MRTVDCTVRLPGKGIADCRYFMDDIYQRVADKVGSYARLYGWDHNDPHWGNFLFSDDLTQANIIEYVEIIALLEDSC